MGRLTARLIAVLLALAPSAASAQPSFAPVSAIQPQVPIVGINCQTQTATGGGSFASMFSGTRSTAELAQWSDGHWSSFGAGVVAATDLGCQFQKNAENFALWARDLTQSAWTKTGMGTPTLTGTGIDGTANSATVLTASTANATANQSIILASGTDSFSVFFKGITVTGNISIALDGATYTNCQVSTTAPIGTQRCSVTTASVTNPTLSIKIANAGDSVIVDAVQLEQTGQVTAPIFTTTAAQPRSSDTWAPSGALLTALQGSYVTLVMNYMLPIASNAAPFRQYLFNMSDSGNARLSLRAADTTGNTAPQLVVGDGTANTALTDVDGGANSPISVAATWSTQVASALSMSVIGRPSVTGSRVSATPVTSSATIASACVCVISQINVYNSGLSSSQLPPLTVVPVSPTSTPISVTAKASDALVDSIGINSHITLNTTSNYWTHFSDYFIPAVQGLGVRHYRDGMNMLSTDPNYSTALTRYGTLCSNITDDEMAINTLHYSTISAALTQFTGIYSALTTCLFAWEGTNEADAISGPIYMGNSWALGAVEWQNDLYTHFHANANVGSLPIILTSVTNNNFSSAYQTWCVTSGASCPMTDADYGNLHPYAGSTYPSFGLSQNITNGELPATSPGNIIATEYGYLTAGPCIGTFCPVSENAQAKYLERGTLEMFNAGLKKAYIYSMLDDTADPGNTNPQDHFGLVRADGTDKPAYGTLQNLINLLKDPGTPITPGSILIGSYQGNPSLHSALFENRNGHYFACYWLEVVSYNTSTQSDITVTPVADTLSLGDTWTTAKVWRPYTSSSPIATLASPSLVPLQVADDVQCVELIP